MNTLQNKTLALAAVFQAATLVKDIATSGRHDQHDMQTIINGIFDTNPSSAEAVFGQAENLRTGLQALIEHMSSNNSERDMDITRYVIAVLHLQGKLLKNNEMLEYLSRGIDRARDQVAHFSLLHENVIANLAGLYADTISQLHPKIMVSGESQYLANTDNASKIRALLLGAVRAGVLWNQLGGSRWQILFKRKRFVEAARRILADTTPAIN